MPKMRLGWYAGASTAAAVGVVLSAFYQRANFYSAMVYLAQSNSCLLVLVNFSLLVYSSFIYALTRLFFGPLRAVEVEQLTERAWFAITETCLAMTIFREEIGAWFLVMFVALVTGKVWGWIGDGRVELLEQQPPANPRLFHLRLSASLSISFFYDVYILRYAVNTVIQLARPNMMVMFLFEFAVLATCSWRTVARYALSITEQNIQTAQRRELLAQQREVVRQQRETIIEQRRVAEEAGEEVSTEPLPSEDDVDELDLEVPGWAAKGEYILWLDLVTDTLKLGIYIAFFFMLLTFYGLPIHIMRDLFMTSRDFVKRLSALLRYRKAIQEMNKYPDATEEDLAREDTCIICREEMRVWNPEEGPARLDRVRPKKLPCGHILHLGCLRSWLERQQVCPTCRNPVTTVAPAFPAQPQRAAAGLRIEFGGRQDAAGQQQQQPPANGGGDAPAQGGAAPQQPAAGGPRIFNLGPIRVGFGANRQQVRELAQQFGMAQPGRNQPAPQPAVNVPVNPQPAPPGSVVHLTGDNLQNLAILMTQMNQAIQREALILTNAQQELQTVQLLTAELYRLRQRAHQQQQQQNQQQQQGQVQQPAPSSTAVPPQFQTSQLPPMAQYNLAQMGAQPGNNVPMPAYASFPSVAPQRNQSPVMARHVAGNSTPIPAGSSELPEGVVLPPGWSLMPLQRVDGSSGSTQPSPQGVPSAGNGEGSNMVAQNMPTDSRSDTTPTQAASTEENTEDPSLTRSTPPARFTRPQFTVGGVEPPPVVAPSPRMPNWGGSAQLFGSSSEPAMQAESNSESSPEASPAKGKGRAATVEDAEEHHQDDGGNNSEGS